MIRTFRGPLEGADLALGLLEYFFVTAVIDPALDRGWDEKVGVRQDPEMARCGRLTDPQLVGDELIAGSVLNRVTMFLWRKVGCWVLQPLQYLKPATAREGLKERFYVQITVGFDNRHSGITNRLYRICQEQRLCADMRIVKRLLILAVFALSLAACGSSDAEVSIVKVQVLDVDGTLLGAVPVSAELFTTPQAGVQSEVVDLKQGITDGEGYAYLELRPAEEYRVSARLDLPGEAGCALVASGWVNSNRLGTKLQLEKKVCS